MSFQTVLAISFVAEAIALTAILLNLLNAFSDGRLLAWGSRLFGRTPPESAAPVSYPRPLADTLENEIDSQAVMSAAEPQYLPSQPRRPQPQRQSHTARRRVAERPG